MAKLPNGVETLQTISSTCVGHRNVTDRQTDERVTAYRECESDFAKNEERVEQKF